MLKILLVDDEHEKRRLIIKSLIDIEGIDQSNISVQTDVHDAKKALIAEKFDLLILDINLPRRGDTRAEPGAGLDILSFIKNHPRAISPTYIVGITAYSDSALKASNAFSSALWKLINFSYDDTVWEESLKEAAKYLISRDLPPYATDGATYHFDLGIIVALEGEEFDAIKALPASWSPIVVRHDATSYIEGIFKGPLGSIKVVAAAAPRMGMPAAAVTASKLIHTFRPRYLAIAGICAGVKKKSNLGDILIADPCFDWGSGKWEQNEKSELRFRPAMYPWRLDETLRRGAVELGDNESVMKNLLADFQGKTKPKTPPTVRAEAMASGGSVLQSALLVDEVREMHKNLVGIEMESYAVFSAAEYSAEPRPTCISIKSVCDFGDSKKSDNFHEFASYASARFLYDFAINKLAPIVSPLD